MMKNVPSASVKRRRKMSDGRTGANAFAFGSRFTAAITARRAGWARRAPRADLLRNEARRPFACSVRSRTKKLDAPRTPSSLAGESRPRRAFVRAHRSACARTAFGMRRTNVRCRQRRSRDTQIRARRSRRDAPRKFVELPFRSRRSRSRSPPLSVAESDFRGRREAQEVQEARSRVEARSKFPPRAAKQPAVHAHLCRTTPRLRDKTLRARQRRYGSKFDERIKAHILMRISWATCPVSGANDAAAASHRG